MANFHLHDTVSSKLMNLGTEDKARVITMLIELATIRNEFHEIWNSVSNEDRERNSEFREIGLKFIVLEEGLERINILRKAAAPILESNSYWMELVHMDEIEQPRFQITGEMSVAVFKTFHINKSGEVVLKWFVMEEIRDRLVKFVEKVSTLRSTILKQAEDFKNMRVV